MDESSWTIDWTCARARAPHQGRSLLCRDRSEMHCERIALTAGLALCQLQGRCDRPITFTAPPADEPRAHWQFLASGAGQLVEDDGEHDLRVATPTLFTPPVGSVAWRIPGRSSVHVISVDLTASSLAHWCDSRRAHSLVFDARRAPVALESGRERALFAQLLALTAVEGERGPLWRLHCEGLVLQALSAGLERLGLAAPRGEIGPGDLVRLRRARDRLHDSAPPVTLLELARAVDMPLRRLQRLYERRYGEPLREAIHRARLEAARRALLEGGSSIKQVARRAGFLHATSFTHAFKAYWGHPPSELTSRRTRRGARAAPRP